MAAMRGEGMATRKERLAKIKKGPGTFVYEGGARAAIYTPTLKRIGRNVPMLDDRGFPVHDASGRQIYQPSGDFVKVNGQPVLGGTPKIETVELDAIRPMGLELKKGVPVKVAEEAIAIKLRCLAFVKEIDESAKPEPEPAPIAEALTIAEPAQAEPKKRGRPRRVIDG